MVALPIAQRLPCSDEVVGSLYCPQWFSSGLYGFYSSTMCTLESGNSQFS